MANGTASPALAIDVASVRFPRLKMRKSLENGSPLALNKRSANETERCRMEGSDEFIDAEPTSHPSYER